MPMKSPPRHNHGPNPYEDKSCEELKNLFHLAQSDLDLATANQDKEADRDRTFGWLGILIGLFEVAIPFDLHGGDEHKLAQMKRDTQLLGNALNDTRCK